MGDKRYVINVQGAIYKGNQYLIARRSEHENYMPNILTLPGGTIEPEDEVNAQDVLLATVKREIMEEVNVEVTDERVIASSYFLAGDEPVLNVLFLCRYAGGEAKAVDPLEVSAVQWMTAEEAIAHPDCKEWTRVKLQKAEARRKTTK
ncbi:MAG: NUDIX domain-containing protein [Chloroflexota bacterium]